MATNVGLHLRYQSCASTYAGLRLASHLDGRGALAEILCRGPAARVHPGWDRRVASRHSPYASFASRCSHLVWTEPCALLFAQVARTLKTKTVLFVTWEGLRPEHRSLCASVDQLVSPYWQCVQILRDRWDLPHVKYVPWDTGYPQILKTTLAMPNALRVALPVGGCLSWQAYNDIYEFAMGLLAQVQRAELTLLTTQPRKRHLERLVRSVALVHPGRISARQLPGLGSLPLCYARHDLTVCLSRRDGLGLSGLASLAGGTPVVAYDLPPFNEYVFDGRNGLLVDTPIHRDSLGIPCAVPEDGEIMLDTACSLLTQGNLLGELRADVAHRCADRHRLFCDGWSEVFGLGGA